MLETRAKVARFNNTTAHVLLQGRTAVHCDMHACGNNGDHCVSRCIHDEGVQVNVACRHKGQLVTQHVKLCKNRAPCSIHHHGNDSKSDTHMTRIAFRSARHPKSMPFATADAYDLRQGTAQSGHTWATTWWPPEWLLLSTTQAAEQRNRPFCTVLSAKMNITPSWACSCCHDKPAAEVRSMHPHPECARCQHSTTVSNRLPCQHQAKR